MPESEINICAVFDADAGYWMLVDKAYNEFVRKQTGNPNRAIIAELLNAIVAGNEDRFASWLYVVE